MRKWILSALSGSRTLRARVYYVAAFALVLALISVAAFAWQMDHGGPVVPNRPAPSGQNPGGGKAAKDASLPITQVMFFNSGVSCFEREGEVDGNARIDLSFPTGVVNDLLKSLVVQDLSGGKISTVNYDSHDPIEKVLRSFSLDLNNNPTFSQILNQARGEKIEFVMAGGDPKTQKKSGIIVGVEMRKRAAGKDAVVDVDYLNVTGDNGLQSIPLDQVQSIRFQNPVIESEFKRALRVVASSHDTQKKTVSLGFTGKGKRQVRVGYVVEQPIWRSTYRLLIEGDNKLHVQGWAIVENTSDDDWNNVRMVLVSGRPISFKMDMYEPLYIPRPTVEPELFASLRPPVYSGAMTTPGGKKMPASKDKLSRVDRLQVQYDRAKDEVSRGLVDDSVADLLKRQLDEARREEKGDKQKAAVADQSKAVEHLQKAMREREEEMIPIKEAKDLIKYKGFESIARSMELGEYYQIIIDQKITLPRQKSAMLPVLNQGIEGSKLSIYNESVQAKYPLLGLRVKNSSKTPLNQGPITVYEDGAYAGDTRILDLQAGEERLMSYALDQAVEIKSASKSQPGPDMNFKLGDGSLTANYKMRETRTYTIKNRATKSRTVLIEHPIRADWKLADPKKPVETTRDVYRFEVKVPAGATLEFDVVEDQDRSDPLTPGGQPQYVAGTGINVKTLTHADDEKLLALKIKKGFMTTTSKQRVTKTYFVQNLSEENRTFTVDHIVADGWVRLDDQDDGHRGPEVFRFVLKVPQGKTADKKVIEERTFEAKAGLVKEQEGDKLHALLANPVLTAEVKTALTKVLAMRAQTSETRKSLDDLEGQLKELSTDQARLRENFKIITPQSEPYKKFLDKFVAMESDIEKLQKEIRQLQTTLQTRQRDYEAFVAALTVE